MAAWGKKIALLVGCNYAAKSDDYGRHGCINDVNAMSALLRSRFQFEDIKILIDEPNYQNQPTEENIRNALENMIQRAQPNANLFFYFSGNGALAQRAGGKVDEGIPAIVASDHGVLTAYDFLPLLERLKAKSPGAIFTFVCDSSYSGGLFNTSPTKSNVGAPGNNFGLKTIPSNIVRPSTAPGPISSAVPPGNGILLSSSKANQESVEVNRDVSTAYGAFSKRIQICLNELPNGTFTNNEVVAFLTALFVILRSVQLPYLYCTAENAGAPFLGAPRGA